MEPRYVDLRNCNALLPNIDNLPFAAQLESSLCGINDNDLKYLGFFHKLLRQNASTISSPSSTSRFAWTQLNIVQIAYVATREINTQAVEFPYANPISLHMGLALNSELSWKIIVPLQYLLKGWGDANKGHQGYVHSITHNAPRYETPDQLIQRQMKDQDSYYYVGITGRNWLQRLSEHVSEMNRGSRKRFHNAWRESLGMKNVQIVSTLRTVNMSFDEAMNWEEQEVDRISSDQYGLNMIPGGFKGLKKLHELGITNNMRISLDERERAIEEYSRRNPRKGIPNPFMKALWTNDDYYLKVIGSREKTLTPDQVRSIRSLHQSGGTVEEITEKVGALHEKQVKDVLANRTYIRVH
jgi:hypothetical protein